VNTCKPNQNPKPGNTWRNPFWGCAEMEAFTIKASKHCGNRCSIPPANQAKPKNTGIDGATPKMGCKSPQNTAD